MQVNFRFSASWRVGATWYKSAETNCKHSGLRRERHVLEILPEMPVFVGETLLTIADR